MSGHTPLSQWAHDRERQRGERPRAYWSRKRGARHALEHQAQAEQLALDFAPHLELKRQNPPRGETKSTLSSCATASSCSADTARGSNTPTAPNVFKKQKLSKTATATRGRSRPTVADCAARPWEVFD